MSRTFPLSIDDNHVYELPINYAVSRDIATRVVDPLQISFETQQRGYFPITNDQMIEIFHIGLWHAKVELQRDHLAELLFDAGMVNFAESCAIYLSLMVSGNRVNAQQLQDKGGKKGGKKKPKTPPG